MSYKINELNDFVKFVMGELEQLIDTTNFYIAFYNEEKQTINIPFISGEVADREFPIGKSMTGYLIKKNKSLFLKSEDYSELIESGEAELIGKFPAVWLGVPLRVEEKVIGAIVVQSYDDHNAFNKDDIDLLEGVGFKKTKDNYTYEVQESNFSATLGSAGTMSPWALRRSGCCFAQSAT